MSKPSAFAHHQFLDLTTTGRTSGHPRTVELWFVVHAGRFYVMAEHHHATGWVKNLTKNLAALVAVAGRSFAVQTRILSPETDKREWQAVAHRFHDKYRWDAGLPIALALDRRIIEGSGYEK